MDPNYDDHDDFFGHQDQTKRMKDFLRKVFGEYNPSLDVPKFTTAVFEYLLQEWEVEITDYPHDIQDRAVNVVDECQANGENVPNTASKIAMEVLPI